MAQNASLQLGDQLTNPELLEIYGDYNGDTKFRTDEALIGFITVDQHLVLPGANAENWNSYSYQNPNDEATKLQIAKDEFILTCCNYRAMGGNNDAIKYAFIRAKMVTKGYLFKFVPNAAGDRCVYTNEVRLAVQADIDAITPQVAGAIKDWIRGDQKKMLDKYWRVIASILGHVLKVRGHHFITSANPNDLSSYESLYGRLWKACAIEEAFPFPDLQKLYRTTFHPFGLKAFQNIYDGAIIEGCLPRALVIRKDSTPAGVAKIGTASAVIRLMVATPWYEVFSKAFELQLKALDEASVSIKALPMSYHVAPRLYGAQPLPNDKLDELNTGEIAANALAPYLVAYIRVECAGSPIERQATLNNAASDQLGLLNRFQRFLQATGREAETSKDIKMLLPLMQAPVPVQPAQQVP